MSAPAGARGRSTRGGRAAAVLVAAFVALAGARAFAQNADYERERRWADEVVPQLVVGEAVWIEAAGRRFLALHAPGADASRPAIVLVHGVGVHPDHGVIGELRTRLSDAGFATLSIQMPVLAKEVSDGNEYAKTFDEATARIAAAARWLQDRGARRLVLASHSMGAWMSNVYFERTPSAPFVAWVCMGITGRIGPMGANTLPVLDVWGENDLVLSRRWLSVTARRFTLASHPGSRQVEIAGADHHYARREAELARTIAEFVTGLPAGAR